jgi:hypothetical protein
VPYQIGSSGSHPKDMASTSVSWVEVRVAFMAQEGPTGLGSVGGVSDFQEANTNRVHLLTRQLLPQVRLRYRKPQGSAVRY